MTEELAMRRFAVWQVSETSGYETAWLELSGPSLYAEGRAVGQLPEPYWLSYTLRTDSGGATTRLQVQARLTNVARRLDLRHSGTEGWTVNGTHRPDLDQALDCDLAGSPVTNTMPIVRHRLHRGPGAQRFVMAFVEVPTLRVTAASQHYRHLQLTERGARVRYTAGSYRRDLLVDPDGLLIDYPSMAQRLPAGSGLAGTTPPDPPEGKHP